MCCSGRIHTQPSTDGFVVWSPMHLKIPVCTTFETTRPLRINDHGAYIDSLYGLWIFSRTAQHIYRLLTKCEVKVAGWWPSCFFSFRVYGLRWSQGPYTCKKKTRPISCHLDQVSLVNRGFIIFEEKSVFLVRHSGLSQLGKIVPALGANHSAGDRVIPTKKNLYLSVACMTTFLN